MLSYNLFQAPVLGPSERGGERNTDRDLGKKTRFSPQAQPLLLLDAAIVVSKYCLTIGEHILIIFVTQ